MSSVWEKGNSTPRSFLITVSGAVVEGDPKADLHLPAGDGHLFDDESEEALAPVEVEFVHAGLAEWKQIFDAEPDVWAELFRTRAASCSTTSKGRTTARSSCSTTSTGR